MKLEDKIAIVTGGAQGIGQGIVLCLAEEGADVVIADIDTDNANKTADRIRAFGRKALDIEADVTQQEKAEQVVESTLNTFGKIDILVNNVGGGRTEPDAEAVTVTEGIPQITDLTEEAWDGAYEVNLKSQVFMSQAVMPHMKAQKSGKIINISSIAGKMGSGGTLVPYSSIKAGVIIFTRALARELAVDNINVNCICPGLIYTPAWQRMAEYLWQTTPAFQELKEPRDVFLLTVDSLTPLGREQTPEDIGHLAVFLVSEDAKNITGQSINVDGGIVMD